jgi:hypothetical protein
MRSSTPPTTQIIEETTLIGQSLYLSGQWNNHVRAMYKVQNLLLLPIWEEN